ncbi:MAG: hypothetical protein WAM94_03855 [Chromatiaceae bacterium]
MPARLLMVFLTLAALIAGCGGGAAAQKRAYRAQEEVAKERLRLVEKYQDCMKDARGDVFAERACQTYRDSAEALK